MMDSTFDLNQYWDEEEEEFVPSTQCKEQSPIDHMSFTESPPVAVHNSFCSPQTYVNQPRSPVPSQQCAVRTPLSPICNNTLHQCTPKKDAKLVKGKKKSKHSSMRSQHASSNIIDVSKLGTPASSTLAASVATDPPSSLNAKHKTTSVVMTPLDGKPIPSNLLFRNSHWSLRETITLMDARAKLLEEMKSGNLGAILKTQDERWEYISKYCLQHGALRSPNQCLFRWDRIIATFKKIHDYERRIPFGKDSYWAMTSNQRDELKLPRSFEQDLYEAMLDRVGSERVINPGNIIYDTSNDMLEDGSPPLKHGKEGEKLEGEPSSSSSGYKRKREDRMSSLKRDLEGTNKRLFSLMEGIDARRAKHDDDLIELTKAEFEETVALNRKRLALEEESNAALKQIAEAFSYFAMHASHGVQNPAL